MKRRTRLFRLFCLMILGVVMGGVVVGCASDDENVKALSYQKYQRINFVFDPTLEVNISGDLVIANLPPGQGKDSNIISVQAGTNVSSGLGLFATVGRNSQENDPYNNTNLVNDNGSFTALTGTAAGFSNFGENKWGYSYCTKGLAICSSDDPSVVSADDWVSGNAGSTTNGYAGLPLYDTTGVQLANVVGNTRSTLQFKIGAKAGGAQAAGEYKNIVNFTAITNMVTTTYSVNFSSDNDTTNMPDNIPDASTSVDINIPLGSGQGQTNAPVRAGYTFMGWCTVSTSSDTCSGNVYQADERYPITNVGTTAGNPLAINLYAMWKSNPPAA